MHIIMPFAALVFQPKNRSWMRAVAPRASHVFASHQLATTG
jgi:hypothetical protein